MISEKLKAGHVLLAAPRRFGKTSIMYRLIDEPLWDYTVIHADLEHLTEPAELITELVMQLVKTKDDRLSKVAQSLSYVPKTLWGKFRKNFEEVELFKVKVKLREDLRPRWRESGEELFAKVAESKNIVLFILDELPMMIDRMMRTESGKEDARILLHWLRTLRQSPSTSKVRFLIAGSIGIARILNELGEIASINDFESVRLKPFPPKVATAFIDELVATQGLIVTPECRQKMLELIGAPVPYFIQIMYSEVAKTFAEDEEPITPETVERVYRDKVLGVDCKTYFDHYYGRLRDYYQLQEEKAAKRILRELAVADSLTRDVCYQFYRGNAGRGDSFDEFDIMMTDLENDFYIIFDQDARRYRFSCKLLRDWWLRHYGMGI